MKNPQSLNDKKRAELQDLIKLYSKIGEAYRLKDLFFEFLTMDDVAKAEFFLTDWSKQVTNSKIQLAKKRAIRFRNNNNFKSMILFIAGKLNFNYLL